MTTLTYTQHIAMMALWAHKRLSVSKLNKVLEPSACDGRAQTAGQAHWTGRIRQDASGRTHRQGALGKTHQAGRIGKADQAGRIRQDA